MSRFEQPPSTEVYICEHVANAQDPISRVYRDGDGDWQFLCHRDHSEDGSQPVVVSLGEVVAGDASLEELAQMHTHHYAEREAPGQPWSIVDETEQNIRDTIEEYGWYVALIDDEGDGPGTRFAYSIGMVQSLGHPEVLVIGQPVELMAYLINEIGERARDGAPCAIGEPIEGLLDDYDCVLKPVDPSHYDDYLGYGLAYAGTRDFPVVQLVWPDKEGIFPWEPGCHEALAELQPQLDRPKS
jgi:hypothetical protein